MKRSAWISPLLLAVVAIAQFGCQPKVAPTNEGAAPTNRNDVRAEPVDKAAIERELLRIENDWPRVVKEKDVEAVKRVEADDIVMIYPDGTVGGKAQDIADMESGALSVESIEMKDLKVNVLSADAAVVTGGSVVKGGKYKLPDGKSIDISGEYRFVDTFARRDGQWKLVAGASVPVRQPTTGASPAAKPSPSMVASPARSPASSPRTTRTP